MAHWLKIPSKEKRREEDIPEPYEIVCVCGVSLSGYRRKTPYRHTCDQCGESYFILPRNTYPPLKARKKKKQIPTQQRITEYVLNSPLVSRLREKRQQKQAIRKGQAGEATQPAPAELSPFELPPPRTRLMTPFRAILAGILLILGFTGYGIWHSRQLERAEVTLKTATEAGRELLEKGDLVGANTAYQQAAQALETLGRHDRQAFEVQQKARELEALNRQAVSPLFEIADAAVAQIKEQDLKSWQTLFDVRYEGSWLIFETTLIPVSTGDEKEQTRYRLNFPVILDEYTLNLELTDPTFREYVEAHPGQPLIFAAQLSAFEQNENSPETGVILLDGKTAFMWSHLDLYEQLGIQFDEYHDRDQVASLLKQQTQFLERSL
ncbi:hypothetical protein [Gimesia panareensis]|uniref:hypothetical protein n=1 Tax=Gimesia panareensis TaxID=2527978 RepID=UPI001188BCBA|nr:hypothetical protein [Gimesia panareensis]QDU48495.1 hypothetical protein Pan110_08100 [Gimesia panareensis]